MTIHNITSNGEAPAAPITSLSSFCRAADISPVTAWRMRKKGWLQTVNICGRQYVTSEAVEEFKRRARAGEFAKVHVAPRCRSAVMG